MKVNVYRTMMFALGLGSAALSACAESGAEPAATGVDTEALVAIGNDVAASAHHHAPPAGVLLVHGAWADGSSWRSVIKILQREGIAVHAVQLREQTLADDVALVRTAIAALPGPLVVAGHSYGGAVISGAAAGQRNVSALVFVAAFAPDVAESILSLNAMFPATALGPHLVFDAQGLATLDEAGILEAFAQDIPRDDAEVLFATQHPFAAEIFGEGAGAPAWATIPSYYAVSKLDRTIAPDLERFLARRIHATTIEIPASHVSMISHPREIAQLIERAATAR
jgi:pimeloyl-ACP methyl ester carboxylesterase